MGKEVLKGRKGMKEGKQHSYEETGGIESHVTGAEGGREGGGREQEREGSCI